MQKNLCFLFTLALLVGCSREPQQTQRTQSTNSYKFSDDPIWQKREKTEMIVVHHSATEHDNVETIRVFHKSSAREFNDIGYHYVITNGRGGPDGALHEGRDESVVGAHANDNGRNFRSVGVCLVGKNEFTPAQIDALVTTLKQLCKKYGITPSRETIVPHHADCPGAGLDLSEIIRRVAEEN